MRSDFADTLDEKTEHAGGIIIALNNSYVLGVPYYISERNLVIGPYSPQKGLAPLKDFNKRKISIPLDDILAYQRFELPPIVRIRGSGYCGRVKC